MKTTTRDLLTMARIIRLHHPKTHSKSIRGELAEIMRDYLRHNDHARVRAAYARGDALYGTI